MFAVSGAQDAGLRILVPLDDSFQAQRVLPYVTLLAVETRGKVNLVRAMDVEDETSFNSVAENAVHLKGAGVSVESSVISGLDAETAIREVEAAWQPDLIALASTKSSGLDRWLNGSVTEQLVKSARTSILVVPPNWERPITEHGGARILVALDGSALAEQALWAVVHLASMLPTHIVLMRAIDRTSARQGAEAYLCQLAARVQPADADRQVTWRCVEGATTSAVVETARELDVDVIAMTTRGHTTGRRAARTAARVFDHASLPLILLGPRALVDAHATQIKIGARVFSVDRQRVGEVHRVVIDLDQQALIAIVLGRGGLARDVLVPADFIDRVDDGTLELRVRSAALEQFPDFEYNELDTPPPTWDQPPLVPTRERKRLGPAQVDVTGGTSVLATDGEVGRVESIELDPGTGSLRAFWIRGYGIFAHAVRVPSEWVKNTDGRGNLRLAATRALLDGYLGQESHTGLGVGPRNIPPARGS